MLHCHWMHYSTSPKCRLFLLILSPRLLVDCVKVKLFECSSPLSALKVTGSSWHPLSVKCCRSWSWENRHRTTSRHFEPTGSLPAPSCSVVMCAAGTEEGKIFCVPRPWLLKPSCSSSGLALFCFLLRGVLDCRQI